MDKIDGLIKDYFDRRQSGVSGRREDAHYPSSEVLVSYLADKLNGEPLERFLTFLKNNPEAQTLVATAREIVESPGGWEDEAVPEELADKAKALMPARNASGTCPHCGKAITPFKKGFPPGKIIHLVWLALAAASFALSFVVPRYFYQCLALSLFFGFKWVIEARAAKTQIMIYKALSDDGAPEHQRLHRHSSRL